MKKLMIATAAAGLSASLFAGLYGDTPDAKHAWAVHDMNRPNPVKVEPGREVGQPPSDAIVLFDGTRESFEKNWCDSKGGPTKWKFVNGTLESVRAAGNICSRQTFGDVQLHVEWQAPVKVEGMGQGRGNSGVFVLGGHYEVQVLDSYETNPADMKNPNYADGQAGSVYGQNPPLVNPTRRPGEWQTYDIVFHQPIFDGNRLVHPGSLTVFLNGVLVQDHWELEGHTWHCRRAAQEKPPATKGSIQFQDHGNPVHFRNVWVRELPSRYANTTHGTFLAKEADVTALRRETAAKLFAKIDQTKCEADQVNQILEVIAYSKDEPFLGACKKICAGYLAKLNAMDDKALDANKGAILSVKRSADVLKRNKVVENCPLCAKILSIVEQKGWNKKK